MQHHGLWFSPKNTTRSESSHPRVSLSTVAVQHHEDHDFLQNCGCHLGSRPQPYILLYFNSSSRTHGGDTPDAPMTTLGPEDRAAHLKSRYASSRSGVTREFRMKISGDGPRTLSRRDEESTVDTSSLV
ncbi:phospholipase D p1 [Dorcoceras hygrometricum]|uniref:Phospholipase D p1 n=1 Tax=Dorcoceras hygrometricum TaxID=472368 RepID=A0A2Z7AE07_9LAMI|nr:phospholipase D p1 [Dorcoceras hygrometricum]